MGWQDLRVSDEVSAADWIRERLHPFAEDVGSVVPSGFPAYARVFHPAASQGPAQDEIRWSDVAAVSGKTVHPEMQFHAIAPKAEGPGPQFHEPLTGVLSPSHAAALVSVLAKHTTTPASCWLCLWDGYGYLHPGGSAVLVFAWGGPLARLRAAIKRIQLRWSMPRPPRQGGPRVRLPNRDYLLFRAPIAEAIGWHDGPNLWWPEDRAWCVATEIDLPYTYVGGSVALVDAILTDPAIEALPATERDGISYTTDRINS